MIRNDQFIMILKPNKIKVKERLEITGVEQN